MDRELDILISALVRTAPALRDRLREDGTTSEPDVEIPVLWLAEVGRSLAGMLPGLSPALATALMSVVEDHLRHGSEQVKDAVATGLLEAVVAEVSAGRLDGAVVAGSLGPASRAYVDAWDQFSLGRSSLGPS